MNNIYEDHLVGINTNNWEELVSQKLHKVHMQVKNTIRKALVCKPLHVKNWIIIMIN